MSFNILLKIKILIVQEFLIWPIDEYTGPFTFDDIIDQVGPQGDAEHEKVEIITINDKYLDKPYQFSR